MPQTQKEYDLEHFKPHEPRLIALNNSPRAQKKKKKRAKRQKFINAVFYITLLSIFGFLVSSIITNHVRITELNSQLAEKDKQIAIMESEQVRLQSEITALSSPERLQSFAESNGFFSDANTQVYYIVAHDKDEVEIPEKQGNWFTNMWKNIKSAFS